MDGSSTQRFLSLTGPLAPRVVVSPLRAMSMKSALRIYLSASYVMKSTTVISHQRGNLPRPPGQLACFPTPAERLYGFHRQRRYKKWRRKRRTSPAQRYYITPEGESTQPIREASAGPGQNPGSPGPKGPVAGSTLTPVRACQPSGILESTAQVPVPKSGFKPSGILFFYESPIPSAARLPFLRSCPHCRFR